MVVKEYWWAGEQSKALKNVRWARATSGQRGGILQWFRTQEAALDRSAGSSGKLRAAHGPAAAVVDEEAFVEATVLEEG